MSVSLETTLGRLTLPAPVLTASGCAAAGQELSQFGDLTQLGAVVTKSVMLLPRSGRATPRMVETPSGMLNSIGLQGPGIEQFLQRDLPWLRQRGIRTIVSIAGSSTEEFVALAHRLRDEPGISALEVNISCPNVENRGLVFACHRDSAAQVIQAVREAAGPQLPLIAKLSPDVTDIVDIAASVQQAGADAVAMINTLLGMAIDPVTLKPILGGVTGGLSGPAIRPVAVRAVFQVHAALPALPILGMGGILTATDALEFLAAGASAVSIGTSLFHDPITPWRIQTELATLLKTHGVTSIAELKGRAHA